MRTIAFNDIVEKVAAMCISANRYLAEDVLKALETGYAEETSDAGKEVFRQLLENAKLARDTGLPLCQDTGLGVYFVEVGDDVVVEGGNLRDAINQGMKKGYEEGFLRKSSCDPFTRKNTGDNTPAIVHFDMVPGDQLKISFMAKGGGSENMSRVTMLAPAQGWEGIKKFVVQRMAEAGPNPCPPTILGIGIGGSFDYAPILAKKALLRKLDDVHPDPQIAAMEKELLDEVNQLGVGPMGLGGAFTSLAVKIAVAPCHLASLPLAINVQCHSARHEEVTL